MISAATAKFLLFLAIFLGPKDGNNNHTIEIVSKNVYLACQPSGNGWTVLQKHYPSQDWPSNGIFISNTELKNLNGTYAPLSNAVTHQAWPHGEDTKLYFDNGDLVEKQGHNKVFYTIDPGNANQRLFIIRTLDDDGQPL